MKAVKKDSRLDNNNGHIFTKKEYNCTIIKMLPYNYCLIKINNQLFKTDFANII
jgi:hypothetical protein